MSKLKLLRGTTGKTVRLFCEDSTRADGSGLTGMAVPATVTAPTTAATVTATGGATTGGALAAAAYTVRYTLSGPGHLGGETTASSASGSVTVASGNVPLVTFPAAPTGGQTYNLYVTNTGTATEYRYATGIATGTYNLALAASTVASPPGANTALNSSLVAFYIREGDASATQITLSAGTVGTWSSGGWREIDATNMPGWYELGLPNAALASGQSAGVHLYDGYNSAGGKMVAVPVEIELDAVNYQDAAGFGLSRLDGPVTVGALDAASGVETGLTMRQALRLFTAVLAGKATDSGGTYTLKRQDGTTTALTVTHDASGNRTAISLGTL